MSPTDIALQGSTLKQWGRAGERRHRMWQLVVLGPGKLDGVEIRSIAPFSREQREHVCAGHYLGVLDVHHDTPR